MSVLCSKNGELLGKGGRGSHTNIGCILAVVAEGQMGLGNKLLISPIFSPVPPGTTHLTYHRRVVPADRVLVIIGVTMIIIKSYHNTNQEYSHAIA